MPGLFVFAILLFIVAVGALITAVGLKAARKNTNALIALGVMLAFGFFGVLSSFASAYNPVGAQDDGIELSFGQPVGHLGPGFHLTAPWESVVPMDEAVQVTDTTMNVKIAGQQIAAAPVSIRWQMLPSASEQSFKKFGNSTSGLTNGLLLPELNSAMNSVYDGYDPIAPLSTGAAAGTPTNPTTAQLSAQVQQILQGSVGQYVQILRLVVQPLQYDSMVQNRINSVLAQTAKTDVAKQAVITAQAQAEANKVLEQNLAQNPLVLVQQCYTGLADGNITNEPGFSCWPGSNSGIVIPAAKS